MGDPIPHALNTSTLTQNYPTHHPTMGCGFSRRTSQLAFEILHRKIHSKHNTNPAPCNHVASGCDRLTHQNTFLNARALSQLLQQDVDTYRRETEWDQYLAHG